MLQVAILRDPIDGSRPGETTHYLAREAERRGHAVWCFEPQGLRWEQGRVWAPLRRVRYAAGDAMAWTAEPPRDQPLDTMDVVMVRHDPPVDAAWLSATWLLERLPRRVLVTNPPRALRDTPEKLVLLELADLAPPTMVSRDPAAIRRFQAEHGDIVLKPLFGKAGDGMFFIDHDDPNFGALLETMVARSAEPVMVQRYLPEAAASATRAFVVDGELVAALKTHPRAGDRRGNLGRAAAVEPTSLDLAQRRVVERVAALLDERGIVFAGIDLVGSWLLEVNVTSPGGVVYLDRAGDDVVSPALWDALERKVARQPSAASGVARSSREMTFVSSRMMAPA